MSQTKTVSEWRIESKTLWKLAIKLKASLEDPDKWLQHAHDQCWYDEYRQGAKRIEAAIQGREDHETVTI